jgi:hypothetical protein
MKPFIPLITSLGLFALPSLTASAGEVVPVRIRMIAAHMAYFNNPDPNGGSLISSSVGFDVVWNMRRFDYSLYTVSTTQKLACRGSMIYTPASGAPGSSGNFSFNPNANPVLYPEPVQTGDIVTLQIPGPVDSSGRLAVDTLVGDRTPGLPFICQVPHGGYAIGGTQSETWSPMVPEAQFRRGYANVQFNIKSLPQVLPFTWTYEASRDDGTVSKIVFFGRVEVSEDAPTVPLTPVDALTLGGYAPPAAGSPPNAPPADLYPPNAADFTKWVRDLFPSASDTIKGAIKRLRDGPSPQSLQLVWAPAKSQTIVIKVTPGAPFKGKLQLAVVLTPKGTTKIPSFPKNSTHNTIVPGTNSLKLVIDPATRKALKSDKAYTVFILAKATAEGGKPLILSKRVTLNK